MGNPIAPVADSPAGAPAAPDAGPTSADPIPQKARDAADYANKNNGAAQSGYVGDRPFANDGREGGEVLPKTDSDGNPITYKEYDVDPYTPGVNRGKERVVIGGGSSYYTDDHYKTFKPIK